MLKTRCGCTRIVAYRLGVDPSLCVIGLLSKAPMQFPDRPDLNAPWETTGPTARRFFYQDEFDRETGLPIYFEEGFYS